MSGTLEGWPAARLELPEAEKEFTRRSDGLARRRKDHSAANRIAALAAAGADPADGIDLPHGCGLC